MRKKHWTMSFIILIIISIFSIAIFNYIINPYGISNNDIIKLVKIKQSLKMKLVKAIRVKNIKPKSIILGTSRAETGYNPNHDYFIKPSFNFATSGSSMYENRSNFEYALKQGNLEKVLLVLDYRMFNSKTEKTTYDFETYFNKTIEYSYLLSLDTLKDSLATIRGSSREWEVYLYNGQRKHDYKQRSIEKNNGHFNTMLTTELNYYKDYPVDYKYKDTKNNSFDDFEKLVESCYNNNIELDIIFAPNHIRLWETLDYYLGYDKWQNWKKDIVFAVDRISQKVNKKVYRIFDFSVYHQFTSEEPPKDKRIKMKYHWETSHYKNELGLIVLDRLSNINVYNDFGVVINKNNIYNHLMNQQIKRKLFIDTKLFKIEMEQRINYSK